MQTSLVDLHFERSGLDWPPPSAQDLTAAVDSVRRREGDGHEMLGWLDLPHRRGEELDRIREISARFNDEVEFVVVIGIGGSYLGARAVLEALEPSLHGESRPLVLFAGHHLEASAYDRLLAALEGREVAINVISKSGTTTEPAIAFRLLRAKLEKLYGKKKARTRIVATTDRSHGALRTLADEEGYATFAVPDDVGGRFSVLTPVGLLPLAIAGVDVVDLLDGAAAEAERCQTAEILDLPAARYASMRHALYQKGCRIEVLASFYPSLHSIAEWWKQLFGESEGKSGRGLFPAAVDYTTDLHSLGQYMQDGQRILLETFLDVQRPLPGPVIPEVENDLDQLNYLAGRPVAEVNRLALAPVADAHSDGGVPSLTVRMPEVTATSLGSLLFFFEYAVSVSGRLLGVNPFDQPGVEAYKKNLFRALGKPGH